MALASFSTILIFGGTSGIGESFARRFHAQGKTVIITGRRRDRLTLLDSELPGLHTYQLDNSDIASLPKHLQALIEKYPSVDTVWVNSGISYGADFKRFDSHADDKIVDEINVNFTAPVIIARHFVPHLMNLGREAHFLVTGSGLGFMPLGVMPVYGPTKAAVHSFLVGLRESLAESNVSVIEFAVPHVRTDFAKNVPGGMPLEDFTNEVFHILESKQSSDIKEVGVAFGKVGAEAWRKAFGPILEARGSKG